MLNCFNEDGTYIKTAAHFNKEKVSVGPQIKFWSEYYGVTKVVPFSCFHDYQREDSVWAKEITTPIETFYMDFDSTKVELLPYYISYNCQNHEHHQIKVEKIIAKPKSSIEFGDDWSENLARGEFDKIENYFKKFEKLPDYLDHIQFTIGNETKTIDLRDNPSSSFKNGINFNTPRASLMTCMDYEIFDDLLIANFMKTTFIGKWDGGIMPFNTYVGKIGDNGLAYTKKEIGLYMKEYAKRAPIEYLSHQIGKKSEQIFRGFVDDQSSLFKFSKKIYSFLNK
jgi:hypothetical protein